MFELTANQKALIEAAKAETAAGFTYEVIYEEQTREEEDGTLRDYLIAVGRRCHQTGAVEMY